MAAARARTSTEPILETHGLEPNPPNPPDGFTIGRAGSVVPGAGSDPFCDTGRCAVSAMDSWCQPSWDQTPSAIATGSGAGQEASTNCEVPGGTLDPWPIRA